MGQLGKLQTIITITWVCTVFPLANFTLDLVVMNIEKRDIQFVNPEFDPPY